MILMVECLSQYVANVSVIDIYVVSCLDVFETDLVYIFFRKLTSGISNRFVKAKLVIY